MTKKKRFLFITAGGGIAIVLFILSRDHPNRNGELGAGPESVQTERVEASLPVVHSTVNQESSPSENLELAAERAKVRRLGHQITEFGLTQKLLLQLRKGTSDQKSYREKRNALRTEKRLVEEELVDLLYGSNEAREEYIAILKQEKDPFVKREMMGATRRLGPILREELAAPLVASSDPGDRKLGVETLPRIGTQKSIDTLSDRAKNERDPEVQAAAVRALTHFVPERTGKEWADGSTIAPTLRELATNQQNLAIREMAFRGLIAQRHLSPEDREFVETFADHETDPNLKEIALSARRALAARR